MDSTVTLGAFSVSGVSLILGFLMISDSHLCPGVFFSLFGFGMSMYVVAAHAWLKKPKKRISDTGDKQ